MDHAQAVSRARIANETRWARQRGDTTRLEELRRDYFAARIEDYIRKTVEQAPPLTDDQRARISALLVRGAS